MCHCKQEEEACVCFICTLLCLYGWRREMATRQKAVNGWLIKEGYLIFGFVICCTYHKKDTIRKRTCWLAEGFWKIRQDKRRYISVYLPVKYTQNYTQKLNWVLSMSQFTKWSTVLNSLSQSSSMHPIWRWRRLRGSGWQSWHIRWCRVPAQKLKFLPPYLCNAAFEASWKKFYPVRTRFLICDQTVSECGFTANLMRMLIFPFSIQTDHYSFIIFAYIK